MEHPMLHVSFVNIAIFEDNFPLAMVVNPISLLISMLGNENKKTMGKSCVDQCSGLVKNWMTISTERKHTPRK